MFRIAVSFFFILFLFTCKAEKPAQESLASGEASRTAAPMPPGYKDMDVADAKKSAPTAEEAKEEQAKTFLSPKAGIVSLGRLLEYRVELMFETKDFLAARKSLLQIASGYGFVQNETLENFYNNSPPSMTATIHVKSSELYKVLLDLEKLGALKSENIQVEDHTEAFALEQIHAKREKIRTARRSELVNRAPAKTAIEAEELLGQSEDAADAAEFEKWKILDRVHWAKITVTLVGPSLPKTVDVPRFGEAFLDLASLALAFLYYLIFIIPISIVVIGSFVLLRMAKRKWYDKSN